MKEHGSSRSSTPKLDETLRTNGATVVGTVASGSRVAEKSSTSLDIQETANEDTASITSDDNLTRNIPKSRLYVIIIGLCLLYFISALDMTILATVYVDIANSYHDLSDGIWIITVYLLSTTAAQPLFGKFSDILGRFEAVTAAALIFCVGSVVCAAAHSMGMLLAGRAIQGIGGGGLLSMTSVILSDVTTERDRGKYTGFLAASWGVASAIGPVMGGAIVENASWRIIFWINLPVCVPTLVVLFFALNIPRPQGRVMEKLRRIDFIGTLVFQCCIVPLILAFAWGGQGHKWISGQVLGVICASVAVGAVFLFVEWKVAVEPIIPLRLFRIRNVAASSICHFCMGACVYAPLMFIPLWELSVKRTSETEAGLRLLPLMVAMVVSATVSGIITKRFGRYREMIWLCGVLIAVGNSLLILYTPSISSGARIGILAVTGLGLGFGIQTLIIAAQCSVNGLDMAATTSVVIFMRTLGGIFGLSILSSVLNNNLRTKADALGVRFPEYNQLIHDTLNDQSVIDKGGDLPSELLLGLVDIFQSSMHKVFIGLIPFSALMVLSTLLFKHVDLNQKRRQTIK
ncbi:hypothetical protein IWW51_001030 [Coemansia sp. RSA 2702]|nr:hypothetical protein IWW52_004399 [Coemansia sp. RSA 2704]KAJ2328729.1 hypothetical protein IWW51_001030 [Coemansia sp. RSA 2702]KAJ2732829.1 hypothetical protein H4R23_002753 [Coemansia sp. Cherry 401B]